MCRTKSAAADQSPQSQPHVLLLVCGGIAAYKAIECMRGLQRAGCDVRVAMTDDACKFVGPTTFEALSGHAVATSLYDFDDSPIPHIYLSDWADVVLVVPCTANVLAKLATGIADDVVSASALACDKDFVIAPAMNTKMWNNPATQHNVHTLLQRGMHLITPATKMLACGITGTGALASVTNIVDTCLLWCARRLQPQILSSKKVLITAGPTHEAIDPVRYIANASSGKMGYALARAVRDAGAEVTLVTGPTALAAPCGVTTIDVTSAREMYERSLEAFTGVDAAILTAAVADWTPVEACDHKRKKHAEPLSTLALRETDDILRSLSAQKEQRIVIGFAAETDDLVAHAQQKLADKRCDMIVANDVSRADSCFGSNTNTVSFVTPSSVEQLPTLSKKEVAEHIVAKLAELLR